FVVVDYRGSLIYLAVNRFGRGYSPISQNPRRSEFVAVSKMTIPIILTVAGIWAASSLSMFFWHIHRGQQVAQMTKKYQRELPTGPRILLAGDSVVFGVGASRPESSISGLLGQDFPNASIMNIGVSGAETDGLVQQLQSVQAQHFAAAIIIIGANDVVHFSNLTTSLH